MDRQPASVFESERKINEERKRPPFGVHFMEKSIKRKFSKEIVDCHLPNGSGFQL